ncbi:MAG: class IIb bacteriocin, lactobin A/cerein 7B family [Treponema sp.]|uniref:class IIb bacteriocin, lactobin A/cerein 7B family n=1 Tax=Treponema sp. TaxID=166 RepID=UPI003FA3224E
MQTLTVKALNGFTALSNEELEMVDGGFVVTGGAVAAAIVWTVNVALLTYGTRVSMED